MKERIGWIIQRPDPEDVLYGIFLGVSDAGALAWFPIPEDGLRFARKQDAEAFIRLAHTFSNLEGLRPGDPRPIVAERTWRCAP